MAMICIIREKKLHMHDDMMLNFPLKKQYLLGYNGIRWIKLNHSNENWAVEYGLPRVSSRNSYIDLLEIKGNLKRESLEFAIRVSWNNGFITTQKLYFKCKNNGSFL